MESAHWGQTDAVYTLFLVAATLALEGRAVVPTWASYALAIGTKLQSLAIAPLLLVIALTRQRIRPVVLGLATMCGILALLMTPWWLNGRLHEAIAAMTTVHGAPRVDVSAYNLWYLLLLGQVQQASSAAYPLGLPFTFETAGIGLFGILVVIIAALVTTRPAIPLAAAALSLGFFMLLTQTHERYMFPTLAFLAVAAAGRPSLWKIYAVLSATYFFNLITIAPFTPLLGTNLIAAQDDSARTVILKGLSLIAALVNVASLCWIVREMARESQDVITSVQAGTRR